MGFFNDLGKKTSETTSKIAKETKLKMKMNENKGKIENLYSQIGKKVYQKHITENVACENVKDELLSIDNLAKEIETAKLEILKLNQKRICAKCNDEIPMSAQFCPKCGEKQPEEKPVVEVKAETTEPAAQGDTQTATPAVTDNSITVEEQPQQPQEQNNEAQQ